MRCDYFEAGECRSCTLLPVPYAEQVAGKVAHVCELLGERDIEWLPPITGPESGFRNKAKLVVGGTIDQPTLGILGSAGGVDLRECGLHSAAIVAVLPRLAEFVTTARIEPYDVGERRGELKYLLVTESPDGELMLRFVLRSQESIARIHKHLPGLLRQEPALAVVTANLQPEHKAVLEGDREIHLAGGESLLMRVNGIGLHLRPRSFFQTNTEIAAALYRQVTEWVEAAEPAEVWDLYCGVGGFALHVADPGRQMGRRVLGIEVSEEAVESARTTAAELGADATFAAGDATAYALAAEEPPDLVIVNPPRRGIGVELTQWLETSGVRRVIYSSCNAVSLARDLDAMPSLRPVRGRLLDMFPQTGHYEVVVELAR
ncbi:MAG: 23S rRNA (uracil(747)-C(5))-methyltransferase RlmC [Nocardioidaceae bacterium]